MGFFSYFAYRHPILNFFFQNPDDKLKGLLRRAVILNVLTLTFTFTILNDQVFFPGSNTVDDMTQLFDDHTFTNHLVVTVIFTVFLFVLEWIMEAIYGITKWSCMETPCCMYFKYAIYMQAFWYFLLNLILYVVLLRGHSALFDGWILSYGLYALVVLPVWILLRWFCFGGKEQEKLREMEQQGDSYYRQAPSSRLVNSQNAKENQMSYA